MIKYSSIERMFEKEGVELVKIHTPAISVKAKNCPTTFFIKKEGKTKIVNYAIKGMFITEEEVKEIVRMMKNE